MVADSQPLVGNTESADSEHGFAPTLVANPIHVLIQAQLEHQEGESKCVLAEIDKHLSNLGGNMGTVVVEGIDCNDGIGSKLGPIDHRFELEMGHRFVVVVVGTGLRDP